MLRSCFVRCRGGVGGKIVSKVGGLLTGPGPSSGVGGGVIVDVDVDVIVTNSSGFTNRPAEEIGYQKTRMLGV